MRKSDGIKKKNTSDFHYVESASHVSSGTIPTTSVVVLYISDPFGPISCLITPHISPHIHEGGGAGET